MAPKESTIAFKGPAGTLEGVLTEPARLPPVAVAVVCHPHPLHQGTMDNKVVHTLARAFAAQGMAVLRFNFRGVGASTGAYDEGRGEVEDARVALAFMARRFGARPAWIAGFSFGSHIAFGIAQQDAVAGLVMVAPPVARFDDRDLPLPACPWLVIHGDTDEIVAAEDVVAWVDSIYPGPEFTLLSGVGHFFHGHLGALRARVEAFAAQHLTPE